MIKSWDEEKASRLDQEKSMSMTMTDYGSHKAKGLGKKNELSLLVISGMCRTDRLIPALFIKDLVHSSWGSNVWEGKSAMSLKYQTKKVKGGSYMWLPIWNM